MAFKFANRVKETTTTTGTGSIDLGGAATGFRAFSDALSDSDETVYAIVDDPDNPVEYEVGLGTLTTGSPDVLSRDTVYDSSNSGAKINLQSGTTYTVIATTAQEQLPSLSGDNTFSGAVTFKGGVTGARSLEGLTLSNNATDSDHDLDTATGAARADDNSATIILSSALTKRADATFAEGDNAGGFESGRSLPTSGTVHVFAIGKADGTADVLLTDRLTPSLPSGFTVKRRIGSLITDSSANFVEFKQIDDEFRIATQADYNSAANVSNLAVALSVPIDITVQARLSVDNRTSSASSDLVEMASGDFSADRHTVLRNQDVSTGGDDSGANSVTELFTDTSGQVRLWTHANLVAMRIFTFGWKDLRGKDA